MQRRDRGKRWRKRWRRRRRRRMMKEGRGYDACHSFCAYMYGRSVPADEFLH
jgi:hypothetical protein